MDELYSPLDTISSFEESFAHFYPVTGVDFNIMYLLRKLHNALLTFQFY